VEVDLAKVEAIKPPDRNTLEMSATAKLGENAASTNVGGIGNLKVNSSKLYRRAPLLAIQCFL
jgi:hypothetical protein